MAESTSKSRPMITDLEALLIPPRVRHRTLGKIRLLNVPIPPFDPADELFD